MSQITLGLSWISAGQTVHGLPQLFIDVLRQRMEEEDSVAGVEDEIHGECSLRGIQHLSHGESGIPSQLTQLGSVTVRRATTDMNLSSSAHGNDPTDEDDEADADDEADNWSTTAVAGSPVAERRFEL
jgi:hypothetical protein